MLGQWERRSEEHGRSGRKLHIGQLNRVRMAPGTRHSAMLLVQHAIVRLIPSVGLSKLRLSPYLLPLYPVAPHGTPRHPPTPYPQAPACSLPPGTLLMSQVT